MKIRLAKMLVAALAALSVFNLGWQTSHADSLPSPGVPQSCGINIHYRPIPDATLQQFAGFGFGCARMDFGWTTVEKSPGQYDFSVYDKLTDQLAEMGCRPLYILDYGNPLYTPMTPDVAAMPGPAAPPRTDDARAAFTRFAAAAAAHFKGRGIIWEIWNEPDGPTFWKPAPSADEYAELAVATAKAIRGADPSAVILAPAAAKLNLDYFRIAFRRGLLKYIDGVSWHPYRSAIPETCGEDYGPLRELIAQYTAPGDPILPIVASEWGYSTIPKRHVSEQTQASYILREWLVDMACGVDLTIYYDYHDDGTDPNDPEANYGILNNDMTPKPAGVAAQNFLAQMRGYSFVHRLPSYSSDDWRLLFRKGSSVATVTWNASTSAPADVEMPKVTMIAPSDPSYSGLLHAASVAYPSGLREGNAFNQSSTSFTVTDPDSAPAHVEINAGDFHRTLTVPAGSSKTVAANLESNVPAGLDKTIPISVVWNGSPIGDLPPVEIATAELVETTVDPKPGGFDVTESVFSSGFHGALRVRNGATVQKLPVDMAPFETRTFEIAGDPNLPTQVAAVDDKGNLIAASPLQHYVLVPGMPTAATSASAFDVVPFPNNVASTRTPARVVAAGDGAPSPAAIDLPYATSLTWLYTELKPHGDAAISDNATEILVWVKSSGDKCNMSSRYVDSTGQSFQPGLGQLDYSGWRLQHIPLRGVIYCWGGAGDGIQHLPLKLDAIVNVDGTKHPNGENDVLVGPAYYAVTDASR